MKKEAAADVVLAAEKTCPFREGLCCEGCRLGIIVACSDGKPRCAIAETANKLSGLGLILGASKS